MLRGGLGRTRPVLVDGVLYVTTFDRDRSLLYGLDAMSGETVSSIEVNARLSGYLAVVENTVYVTDYWGTCYAITEA
ncbi:MAG: hypothetical protein BRD23_02875 [Halobacteriales archaeon SW_9_67_25]|nr:MAG: hypothetical protein BRD23_02875 [Halobacteriales archaeon SW_9_67_25]